MKPLLAHTPHRTLLCNIVLVIFWSVQFILGCVVWQRCYEPWPDIILVHQYFTTLSASFKSCCKVFIIKAVEVLCHAAVHVEPPVTGEVLLAVEGPYGAEPGKAWLGWAVGAVVVHLALTLWVSIEPWRQSITGEGGLGNLGEVRIVSARGSRDGADLILLEAAGGAHKEESQKSCIRNIKYKYSDMKCRNAIKAARLSVMKHFNGQRRNQVSTKCGKWWQIYYRHLVNLYEYC